MYASPTGILLVNLGTPDAPESGPVRRYLREFLTDPRVIDIPAPLRFGLVNGIIAPFRAPKSAAAYREVWTERGSPLLMHGRDLASAIGERFGDAHVRLAMRYGNPSIASGLAELKGLGCDRLVVVPLYPHYASSSTGSTLEKVYAEAGKLWNAPFIDALEPFYDHPGYIEAFRAVGQPVLDDLQPDHVLFSYHGLPERHCKKSDDTGAHCLASPGCCATLVQANRNCYRAQCMATSRALKSALGLTDANSSTAFQSRLGRDPWIQPYTDEVVVELAKAGTKRVAVFCPAFVADCLETIEEIGMRARDDFQQHGGERLELVPSLNASPAWVEGLAGMLAERLPGART